MRPSLRTAEQVRRCLLGLLAGDAERSARSVAALGSEAWPLVRHMAWQHRLEPLLHHRTGEIAAIPVDLRAHWKVAHRSSAMAALAAQAALLRAGAVLDCAGLPYAALKGARLAWHAYPHPALRPMRDIDILTPPGRTREAYDLLLAAGFLPSPGATTPLAVAAVQHKHLPGLCAPAGGATVEVHSRLFEHLDPAHAGALFADSGALLGLAERLTVGGQLIAFLPPTETLLHLIVHAVYEHRFDNGPQVFDDLAVLIAHAAIDWPQFWRLAREGGWERGCQLLLELTARQRGPLAVTWDPALPAGPDEPILDAAALMTLQDTDLRGDLAVQAQLAGLGKDAISASRPLRERIFAPRHVIAAHAGKEPGAPGIWQHYPAWLTARLSRTLAGLFDRQQRAEVARAVAVGKWLGAEG